MGNKPTFYQQATDARKVLVLDLGFLGDTIHLLPALWAIRQAWPDAELHVMVSEHVTSLLEIAPWIDHVWGYPRFPKGPKPWQDLGRIKKIRSTRFDAVLNLNGSERSSVLTWLSGAPLRLGRCRSVTLKSRIMFTHPIALPRGGKLVSEQHCEFIRAAGIHCSRVEYNIAIPPGARRDLALRMNVPDDASRRLIHVSPFTTQDYKEIPSVVLAEFLNRFHFRAPNLPLVISCADNSRERLKLDNLLSLLKFSPHYVFAGTLSLVEMVAVLSMSRVHVGGDSGGLHVAVMTGTPTVSWFRRYTGAQEWMPVGPSHRNLFGEASETGIQGMDSETLSSALEELLLQAGE